MTLRGKETDGLGIGLIGIGLQLILHIALAINISGRKINSADFAWTLISYFVIGLLGVVFGCSSIALYGQANRAAKENEIEEPHPIGLISGIISMVAGAPFVAIIGIMLIFLIFGH